jgi:hypothetical protein
MRRPSQIASLPPSTQVTSQEPAMQSQKTSRCCGHKILRCVVAENEVAALYEIFIQGPRGQSPLAIGGFFTAVGDRLSSGQVIYDSAAFDAIVSLS